MKYLLSQKILQWVDPSVTLCIYKFITRPSEFELPSSGMITKTFL